MCIEFAAAGKYLWHAEKYLWLGQIIRDLACGDIETLFVVIRLGAMEWEKTRFICFQDLSGA